MGHRADALQREREIIASTFDYGAEAPLLKRVVGIVLERFGKVTSATAAPILRPPPALTADDMARTAVDLALARFGCPKIPITVTFVDARGFAGRIRAASGRASVELARTLASRPATLYSVTAHEIAHLVLERKGIRLDGFVENEQLADAAAVLVGFGPIMLRGYFRQWWDQAAGGVETVRMGQLHPVALALLAITHAELAEVPVARYPQLFGYWGRIALQVRAAHGQGARS